MGLLPSFAVAGTDPSGWGGGRRHQLHQLTHHQLEQRHHQQRRQGTSLRSGPCSHRRAGRHPTMTGRAIAPR